MSNITPVAAFSDNYIWLIPTGKHSIAVVDPGEATAVISYCQQHRVHCSAILITHHHADHTGGILPLSTEASIPVYGPATEDIAGVTHTLNEGDQIQIGEYEFEVMHIPGHTLGHIAYVSEDILFCGDTLFSGGCGRLFEGTAEQMYHSLQRLAALPDATQVYCAHEYTLANLQFARKVEPSNSAITERIQTVTELRQQNQPSLPSRIDIEKNTNVFLRTEQKEIIAQVKAHTGLTPQNPIETFAAIRAWKDQF